MTDRELLELAAKAAGLWVKCEVHGADDIMIALRVKPAKEAERRMATDWNPLTNDGDALRLAVKLRIGMQSNGPDHWQTPSCTIILFDGPICGHRLVQQHGGDEAAATRRAIVRAAAEIGKAMP